MLLLGYCYGIRSRLCEEVEDRLTFRWFCRLDLDDQVPDHSTFSKNRHGRFRDSDVLRHIEELGKLAEVLRRGGEQKLVPRPTWAAQAQPVEAQDALQMCKLHLDLLAVAPRKTGQVPAAYCWKHGSSKATVSPIAPSP